MKTASILAVICAVLAAAPPARASSARSESLTISSGPVTLSLSDSVARALEAATTVVKARIADRLAAEQLLQGYAQFLPNLDVVGAYTKVRGISYLTTGTPTIVDSRNRGYSYQVSSVLNLFSGLSDYGSFKSALGQRKAAALNLERARQEIVFDVAQAYLQVQLDDRVTAIADENAKASRERQTLLEQQAQLGARSLADLYRQQAQTSSDEALVISARNKRRDDLILLLRRLRLDLGRDYVLPEVALDSAAAGGPYDDEGALVADALNSRPDLRAAWNQAQAARGAVTASRSGFFPRLDLGWSMVSTARLLDTDIVNGTDVLATLPAQRSIDSQLANQIDYTVGVTATWGIFDRLTTRAASKAAEAAASDARLDFEDARLQVEGDVKQAFGDFHAAELTLTAAREGLKAARESYDAVKERYAVSASSLLDLLTAQTALLQAESALAQAEVGFYLQGRQMEFALGRMPVVAPGLVTGGKADGGGNWAFMVRALRYRNYRLFFGGQIVSLVGNWMTMTATSWLVYRLTGSAKMLGLVGFAGQLPSVLLTPLAGIVVDRWNQHRLLMTTQVMSMLQSFALAALVFSGHMTIPALIALNVLQGLINAFDMPCRQSFVISLIESREDLSNAIALNSSMFNLARIVGPAVAGVVIAAAGEGWCFMADGLSFLAVLVALASMTVAARPARTGRAGGAKAQFKEGWRYVAGSIPIRTIMTLLAAVCLLGVPYAVLIPIFAGKILGGGPHMLGLLMTASGAGALLAAVWLASLRSIAKLGRALLGATAGFGAALIAFGLCRTPWLSFVFLLAAGCGFMLLMASSNTIIQSIVDEDKRGRVMSFLMLAILGTAPLGSLIVGMIADRIGAPATVILEGACCLLIALWFATRLDEFHAAVHPIYARMGLMPEAALAGDAAVEMRRP